MRPTLVSLLLTAAVATAARANPCVRPGEAAGKRPAFCGSIDRSKCGDSWIWTAPSGVRMGSESMNFRGQVLELDSENRS